VKPELDSKISRERIGHEVGCFIYLLLQCVTKPFVILDDLSKIACKIFAHQFSLFVYLQIDLMLSDKNPIEAMCDIHDLGLSYVVSSFPGISNTPVFDKCDWYVLDRTSRILHVLDLGKCLSFSYISRYCWL
jgi:hypothetical protein